MDNNDEDLSTLERRMSGWRPATGSLDADAMLFAAGRASVQRGVAQFAWPALTGCLALVAVCLGTWLAIERGQRQALAAQLQERTSRPAIVGGAEEPPQEEELAPDSYLAGWQALGQGADSWPAHPAAEGPADPRGPKPVIPQVGRPDTWLEP
jgi:hypothetical protein